MRRPAAARLPPPRHPPAPTQHLPSRPCCRQSYEAWSAYGCEVPMRIQVDGVWQEVRRQPGRRRKDWVFLAAAPCGCSVPAPPRRQLRASKRLVPIAPASPCGLPAGAPPPAGHPVLHPLPLWDPVVWRRPHAVRALPSWAPALQWQCSCRHLSGGKTGNQFMRALPGRSGVQSCQCCWAHKGCATTVLHVPPRPG